MKQSEIPALSIDDTMSPDTRALRRRAPGYLQKTLDETRLQRGVVRLRNLQADQVESVGGGADAATYLIHSPHSRVIIKFGFAGVDAEVEAINAWRQRSARVPNIISFGVVPGTKSARRPVKYMIQEALITHEGRVVELCTEFLAHYPARARSVGRQLGHQLAKMHQAVAARSFGEFADTTAGKGPYSSWASYMIDYFDVQKPYLRSIHIDNDTLQAARDYIGTRRYVRRGRYLHGDFSIRNAAVKSFEPLKVSIFDPNPLIGDPTWDIAPLFNNYEYQKRRLKHDDSQQVLHDRDLQLTIGFRQGYIRRIYADSLRVSQLLQAILQARFRQGRIVTRDDRLDVKVRQEFIRDILAAIISKAAA